MLKHDHLDLAWGQLGAAILDATENYALIKVLLGSHSALWPALAKWCAIPKFLTVALDLLYSAFGLLLREVIKEPFRGESAL